MLSPIDQEVIRGFVAEVREYLPTIRRAVGHDEEPDNRAEVLEEAHRLLHSIKGAGSMVGLVGLGHLAFFGEELVEQIAGDERPTNGAATELLDQAIERIERYVDELERDTLDERDLLADVLVAFRRFRGEPREGDAEFLALLTRRPGPGAEETPKATSSEPPTDSPVEGAVLAEMEDLGIASAELVSAFRQEAEEHLQEISRLLRELQANPREAATVPGIRRSVHTLKGAASMVGFHAVGWLSHRMEDLLDRLHNSETEIEPPFVELLFETADALEDLVQGDPSSRATEGPVAGLFERYRDLLGGEGDSVAPSDLSAEEIRASLGAEPTIDLRAADESKAETAESTSSAKVSEIIRVPFERLDELVRLVSELVVHRSTFEQHHNSLVRQVGELGLSLKRLKGVSSRFESDYEVAALVGGGPRDTAAATALGGGAPGAPTVTTGGRIAEFDELEFDRYTEFHLLTRALAETASDIGTVGVELEATNGDFDTYLTRQARLTSEIQDRLMRLRMVPVATLASRLHRAVRVTAAAQGKEVDLTIEGEEVELDKGVIEEMAAALLHVVRNAVDHGIEPPELRRALGKAPRGRIRLRAAYEGTQVVLEVTDDGAGLDAEAIRAEAVARGLVSEAAAAALSDQEALNLIFVPGLSTAEAVSEISGRGVGLDIVKSTVMKLKGTVAVRSRPEAGVRLLLRLPMTLAIARVLLVRVHGETLAIPLAAVTRILRVGRAEVERVGEDEVIRLDGDTLPLIRLGEALRFKQPAADSIEHLPVLIMQLGDRRVAVAVDQLVEAREAVVKNLGSLLGRVVGITGATLMGDGTVVLIVNPADLVGETAPPVEISAPVRVARSERRTIDVLIVDDSLSVRRVLSNLARSKGWNPLTAKDGVEALEVLQQATRVPDVILLDIEMPRMDGYELTSTLRSLEIYRAVPIVMITSRAGQKHRQKAFDLGANDYLVKPYQPDTLVSVVLRLARNGAEGTGTIEV